MMAGKGVSLEVRLFVLVGLVVIAYSVTLAFVVMVDNIYRIVVFVILACSGAFSIAVGYYIDSRSK